MIIFSLFYQNLVFKKGPFSCMVQMLKNENWNFTLSLSTMMIIFIFGEFFQMMNWLQEHIWFVLTWFIWSMWRMLVSMDICVLLFEYLHTSLVSIFVCFWWVNKPPISYWNWYICLLHVSYYVKQNRKSRFDSILNYATGRDP